MEYGVSHYYSNRAKYGNVEVSEESEGAIEMTDKPILSNEDRSEMLKFYQTIKVDGNGKSVKMKYDEHIVRHDTLRLLEDIEHFITTIESQNKQIDLQSETLFTNKWRIEHLENESLTLLQKRNEYFNENTNLLQQVESQKEEIENKDRIHNDYRKTALERIAYQEYQIESLKAITELAVKGLKLISDVDTSSYSNDVWQMRDVANDTLSEIERVTHEAP